MMPIRISRWSIFIAPLLALALLVLLFTFLNAVPVHADANAGNARDFKFNVYSVMNFGNDSSLNASTSLRTMETWVKFHTFNYFSRTQEILSKSSLALPAGMEIIVDPGDLSVYVAGTTGGANASAHVSYPTSNLQTERWYHIAATHNGPGTALYLYVDGVQVGTPDTVPEVISDSLRSFTIGNLAEHGRPFTGQIDEVRLWNTPRTGDQIRANMYKELIGNEPGLVAYYNFNQTTGTAIADQSTFFNNGVLTYTFPPSDPNWVNDGWVTSGAFYGPGNALAFNGVNNYVSANSPLAGVSNATNLTFMAWVKRNANSSTRDILSLGNSGDSSQVAELRLNSSNQLEYVRNGGTPVASTGTIGQGAWTHVAVVQNGTNVQLYINGLPDGTGTINVNTTGINSTSIGSHRSGGINNQFFTGQIDEVQLWNANLTSTQIRDFMNRTLAGDESGLLAYYRMDYGIPGGDNTTPENLNTLYDITGHYTGTLNNFALTGTTSNWVSSDAFNTWIGGEGTNWTLPGNWSRGAEPVGTDNVGIINYPSGNSPVITDTANFNHLVIASSATLTATGGITLNVGGNWINDGSFNADSSTVAFGGGASHSLVLSGPTTFDNLTVNSGNLLVETEPAPNAIVSGALDNSGTIRKSQSVTGTGSLNFGLTGVNINVGIVGNLNALTVDRIDANQPNASVLAMQTGRYWRIDRTLAGGSAEGQVDITLPYTTSNATSKVCRYVNGLGAGFDCGQNSANTFVANTSVTRSNYPTADWSAQGSNHDNWTVGTGIDSPTAVTVQVVPSTQIVHSGASATVTASVLDSIGNQVPGIGGLNGVIAPAFLGSVSSFGATNASGVSLGTWTAGNTIGGGSLSVGNGSITGTALITLTAGAPYTITLQAHPAILVADGSSTSTITATVTDQYNNFVADGTSISFSAVLGSVGTPRTTTNGHAVTTFTSGLVAGTATITATANSHSGSVNLALTQGIVDLSTSTKTASAQIIYPTNRLTYTIVLTNSGNMLGTSLTLTDAIPSSTTYVPGSLAGVGATYNSFLNQIEWSGSIPQGGSTTLSYAVVVGNAASGSIVNKAYVSIYGVQDVILTASATVKHHIYLPIIMRSP